MASAGLSSAATATAPASSASSCFRSGQSTRRTRVVISCTECHRRKQKCDRQQPCNQCCARKVESLCRYTSRPPPSLQNQPIPRSAVANSSSPSSSTTSSSTSGIPSSTASSTSPARFSSSSPTSSTSTLPHKQPFHSLRNNQNNRHSPSSSTSTAGSSSNNFAGASRLSSDSVSSSSTATSTSTSTSSTSNNVAVSTSPDRSELSSSTFTPSFTEYCSPSSTDEVVYSAPVNPFQSALNSAGVTSNFVAPFGPTSSSIQQMPSLYRFNDPRSGSGSSSSDDDEDGKGSRSGDAKRNDHYVAGVDRSEFHGLSHNHSQDYDNAFSNHRGSFDEQMDSSGMSESESDFDNEEGEDEDDVVDVLGYFRSGVSNIARDIAELKLSPKFIASADFFTAAGEYRPRKSISSRNNKVVQRILRQMPPRPYVEILTRIFFEDANFYQSINELEFCDSLDKWWVSPARADDIVMATLTFRIMSIALQFVPEEHMDTVRQIDESLDSLSSDYSQAASELAALLPDCVDKVHESILHSEWLKGESRMKESWYCIATAVRMAQEIKLHIEEPDCPPSYERERRRRIWWTIYYWDRCMGLTLGRPIMIADEQCNVPLPVDLPDDCMFPVLRSVTGVSGTTTPGIGTQSNSASPSDSRSPDSAGGTITVTPFTVKVLSFRLSQLMSDLDTNPQRLFKNLTIFTASLPPCFSIYAPDTSLDDEYPYLVVHREMLASTICMVLCALYRRKVDIPNPLSFCLRLLTAAERQLSFMREHQYRQFMIVYMNLEPSVLICREILRMSGRLAEAGFVVSADRNGNAIDVFTCLRVVDGSLERLKRVRPRNKIAAKAYRILKELLRRVKIQVEREKARYIQLQALSQQPIGDEQTSDHRDKAVKLEIEPPSNSFYERDNLDEQMYDEPSMLALLQRLNAQAAGAHNVAGSSTAPSVATSSSTSSDHPQQAGDLTGASPITPPESVVSVRPELICGKVPIVMPAPPSILGCEDSEADRQRIMQTESQQEQERQAAIAGSTRAGPVANIHYINGPSEPNLQQNPHANTTHATVVIPPPDIDFVHMDMDSEMMFSWADAYNYDPAQMGANGERMDFGIYA
ncbi:fungal-specific transcription factor domain-containing protein [Lipomyces oligophaga]|uniref:fungal-specific transcription factor domain-containing protein n=1 Tax=Lipomyces oligophaga TaxID=45792 RepID=UPI0034CE4909